MWTDQKGDLRLFAGISAESQGWLGSTAGHAEAVPGHLRYFADGLEKAPSFLPVPTGRAAVRRDRLRT